MANLCVKWETQSSAFLESISKIHLQERFSDATILCQGRYFSVHRIVLSSCSSYFEDIFEKITSKHPVIVFTDIEPLKMELLLNFMYQGEAEVDEEHFMAFMKTGEALKIKGITVDDVYTFANKFFNKKRKRTNNENLRSKRRLKGNCEPPSMPLDYGMQDEGNDNVYSVNSGSANDRTCENEPDSKDLVIEEPYFDGEKESELLIESTAKSSLTNKEGFDNIDNPGDSRKYKEEKDAKNIETFYHVDGVSIKMGDFNSEAQPSVSLENCSLNNDQEPLIVNKKKISAQKRKNSSKFSAKKTAETVEVIANLGEGFHNHIPAEGESRRRCSICARRGREKRTKLFCTECHLPFCRECFGPWHLQLQLNSILE